MWDQTPSVRRRHGTEPPSSLIEPPNGLGQQIWGFMAGHSGNRIVCADFGICLVSTNEMNDQTQPMEEDKKAAAALVRYRTESRNEQEQLLDEYRNAAQFVLWADQKMRDPEWVKECFPEERFRADMGYGLVDRDLGGEWHLLRHRYNISFLDHFISFMQNTPTYSFLILQRCNKRWIEEEHQKVEGQELEVLGYLTEGTIADCRTVERWKAKSDPEALSDLYLAMARWTSSLIEDITEKLSSFNNNKNKP
jgi:hypothetical protein